MAFALQGIQTGLFSLRTLPAAQVEAGLRAFMNGGASAPAYGAEQIAAALLDTRYADILPSSPLYEAIAKTCGGRSILARNLQEEAALLAHYTSGEQGGTAFNVSNRQSVQRMLMETDDAARSAELTHQEVIDLRRGMLISDVGKRMELVSPGGILWEAFEPFHGIAHLDNVPQPLPPSPYLDALADWLRHYRIETGAPLKFNAPAIGRWSAEQRNWGIEAFAVGGDGGDPFTHADRVQALRFFKIVYHGRTVFYPEGLMFHEVVGHMLGTAWGFPPHVLGVNIFHNGPAICMTAGTLGDLSTYHDATNPARHFPFWALLTASLLEGPYPLPWQGNKLGIIHTLLDRLDQGLLQLVAGSLQGGPRKILGQRLMVQGKKDLVDAIKDASTVPQQSAQQIHALWFHRIGGTPLGTALMPLYRNSISRLERGSDLFALVDLEASSQYEAVFRDGHRIAIRQEFTADGKNFTPAAAEAFLDAFFGYLAQFFEV